MVRGGGGTIIDFGTSYLPVEIIDFGTSYLPVRKVKVFTFLLADQLLMRFTKFILWIS